MAAGAFLDGVAEVLPVRACAAVRQVCGPDRDVAEQPAGEQAAQSRDDRPALAGRAAWGDAEQSERPVSPQDAGERPADGAAVRLGGADRAERVDVGRQEP